MNKRQIDLNKLSALRKEEEIKRRRSEEEERLEAIGQESDIKAAKWVKEDLNERERADKEIENKNLSILTDLVRNKKKYHTLLTLLLMKFLKQEDISPKYTIDVISTDIGIVVSIRGTGFRSAFKTVGVPKFDLFAAKAFAIRVGDTTAHLDGFRHKTKGGILMPDEMDIKKTKHAKSRSI